MRSSVWGNIAGGLSGVVMFCFAGAVQAADPGSPEETIEVFNHAILEAMAVDAAEGILPQYRIMYRAVGRAFEMKRLARATINIAQWRTWTVDQKKTFVVTLQRYQSAVLADRFESGRDISFVIDRTIDIPRDNKLVETRIIRQGADEEDIQIDYRLARLEDRWRIIDVYLGSKVSEVAMRRSEYSQVVRDSGYDALISALEKQTREILGDNWEPV